MKKYYVTTAIAYPNSVPHLGHALEIIQADVTARFNRLLGKEVFFQTGTDEHGIKNWQTAKKQGKDILEFLDGNVKVFKELFSKLNISYDNFIRTSDKKRHYPGAVKLWKALIESGDLYKKKYEGLYCSGCEEFKTEKELVDGKCPNHPTKGIDKVSEENYFFRLSRYKDKVIENIKNDEYEVIPKTRKNEILSWLKDAKDISFSRPKSSLPWGIPVPGDEEQVMYVWCDALSNYITGIGYDDDEKGFNELWPCDVHIIGKDILRFHAAFWPAMLLSAGLDLPKKLFVHGFIRSKGQKMSKSTGNVIEPFSQIEKYGVDQFRFYLTGAMPLDSDGDYSEKNFIERINTELVGNLSNFCYRTISFLNKNLGSEIKDIDDSAIIDKVKEKVDKIKKHYSCFNLMKAVEETLAISALGNRYFQENEPWKLIREDKEKARKVLGTCINIAKNLSILLWPVMPKFSSKLQKQLNVKELRWEDISFDLKNHKVNAADIIFKRFEPDPEKEFPLNLKVAEVISVKNHPDADKLLVLQIDLGTEKRQLVAGLRNYYSPEELTGRKIIVVTNLKPAKLRGIESQGMLLAAEDEKNVSALTADAEPGTSVDVEGYKNNTEQINFDNFLKVKLRCVDNKAFFNDKIMKAGSKEVYSDKVKEGKIR